MAPRRALHTHANERHATPAGGERSAPHETGDEARTRTKNRPLFGALSKKSDPISLHFLSERKWGLLP